MKPPSRRPRARALGLCAAALGLGAAALPVRADPAPRLIDGADGGAVLEIARQFGFAERGPSLIGAPTLNGRMSGFVYAANFTDCFAGPCGGLQFRALWGGRREMTPDAEALAVWNAFSRSCKASVFESSAMVTMHVTLTGGVSPRNLETQFQQWADCMRSFETQIILESVLTLKI